MGADLAVGTPPRDLIPGDSDDVARLAARLRTLGGGMAEAADRLGSVRAGEWQGPAGDAFRALVGGQPARFETAGSAFLDASAAIARYAEVLRDAQDDAGRVVRLYEQAQRRTQGWQHDRDSYDAATRSATTTGSEPPAPRPPDTDPGPASRRLVGQPCWHLGFSYGDELCAHFGEKLTYGSGPLVGNNHGEWELGTRASQWVLRDPVDGPGGQIVQVWPGPRWSVGQYPRT